MNIKKIFFKCNYESSITFKCQPAPRCNKRSCWIFKCIWRTSNYAFFHWY